jgi:preprotein translocase subunit SecB
MQLNASQLDAGVRIQNNAQSVKESLFPLEVQEGAVLELWNLPVEQCSLLLP